MNKKLLVVFLFILIFFTSINFLLAQSNKFIPPTPALLKTVQNAFALDDRNEVISTLVGKIVKEPNLDAKKYLLTMLASYEEGLEEYLTAAKHYLEAAWTKNDRDWSLSLDAARCYIAIGEIEQAESIIKSVLLGSFNQKDLIQARVYSVVSQISGLEREQALSLCENYAKNKDFEEYAPMLLFILWWAEENETAKSNLINNFPHSPEAMVIKNKVKITPNAFWYLMERKGNLFKNFNKN